MMIPTKIHGLLDYLTGVLLMLSPWLFGFTSVVSAALTAIALGTATLFYSLITDYEWSIIPMIPFRIHLLLDLAAGALLACSPWILGFYRQLHWPHMIIGLSEIAVVLLSKRGLKK